jgi:hypothetical protein
MASWKCDVLEGFWNKDYLNEMSNFPGVSMTITLMQVPVHF